MKIEICHAIIASLCLVVIVTALDEEARGRGGRGRGGGGGGRRQPRKGRGGTDITKSLTINYPLQFFQPDSKEWRSQGERSF